MSALFPPLARQTTEANLPWQQLQINTREQVPDAVDAVVAQMEAAHLCDKDIFAIRLVLEEGLVNALKHGNGDDPAKQVELRFRLDDEMIVVEVEDEGYGFHPENVPDPLAPENMERPTGRGLLLMRAYTTWLRHNVRGNCVRFARQCVPLSNPHTVLSTAGK
jgi:serine/threonine-protein kinase RsbW